jgi:elongation factor Ts
MVEVNAETDFVARNDHFQGLVKLIADVALSNGGDAEAVKAAKVGDKTVQEAIQSAIATIGENMSLRRATSLKVGNGVVGTYMHNSISEGLGKIGVLVALESAGDAQELAALGRLVAMHVAAANPLAVDPSGLSAEAIEREKGVLADKAKASGKPANVIEKIVESGLKTFYKEVCLLDQPYVHDDKKNVAQALKEAEAKVGAPIRLAAFVRYKLGEGIEKQDSDFAAEVAAAAGTN